MVSPIRQFLDLITFKGVGTKIKVIREEAILNIIDSYSQKSIKERLRR